MTSRLASLCLLIPILACGPLGPMPGGKLDGETAAGAPSDWSFTEAASTIQLEVRRGRPYSVNLWCVAIGARLYVASGEGASSVWAGALLDDPQATVRILGNLYEVVALRISDPVEIAQYLEALAAKYEVSDAELADFQPDGEVPAVLFRLDPATG